MRRFGLPIVALLFALSGSPVDGIPTLAAGTRTTAPSARTRLPVAVHPGQATAIRLTFPKGVAAMDGRLAYDAADLELIGVAPVGGGMGLRPVPIAGGAAFGAYDLRPVDGVVSVDLVVVSDSNQVRAKVIVGSVASRTGRRLDIGSVSGRNAARRGAVRALASGRTIGRRDVAIARAEWAQVRETGGVCAARRVTRRLDVDGDGCADIVDVQALVSARGTHGLDTPGAVGVTSRTRRVRASGGPAGTLTVDSTADSDDAAKGDGVCADAQGACTLRAAISEAELLAGDITIDFDLPGTAPVTIQLGSRLPYITRLGSSLTIDGYSQPGSAVNTAAYGSDAVPGVRLRGNGIAAHEVGLYITSGGNLVRGLVFSDLNRGIVIDGPDAAGNQIMGNWIGFDRSGKDDPRADMGVLVNTGATDTRIGSSERADRNVIGNFRKAIDQFGPTTLRTSIQGNLLCIAPGGARATCAIGVDHDFGPKDDLVGGTEPGEGNVIGPTTLQGIELSHGWDPDTRHSTAQWRISGNRIIGNWVGFRKDGRYHAAFRSGLLPSAADNANGINVYDGVYDNVISGNHVASVYDGIQLMSPRALRNEISDNIIGVSPRGERAPLAGWGIVLDWNLKDAELSGNVIRNARTGGVGLVDPDVRSVRISRTIVSGTSGPAIRLARHGHYGANHLLEAPRVTSARMATTGTVIRGRARSGAKVQVYRSSRGAGRSGLPSRYLGAVVVPASGVWRVVVSGLRAGDRVTTLQIRTGGDTSTMSKGVRVRR